MANRLSKLSTLSWLFALTLITGNPLWAEDIEIFFGRTSSTEIQPNVLFILDGSGSMAWYDCANGTTSDWSCNDGTVSGTTTRLARMKTALKDVIANTSNINAGLMRLSHGESGGRVTFPIRPIDQQLCGDEPCDQEKVFTTQARTSAADDDAIQRTDGEVIINQTEIAINKTDDQSTENVRIGLRFPDIKIPQGATITEARLDLTSLRDNEDTSAITIFGEASSDATPYQTIYNNISARSQLSASVNWSVDNWLAEGNYESPDIAPLIQGIVNQADWCGGNAAGLILQGSGTRYLSAFDNGAGNAPSLTVSYTLDEVSSTGGCTRGTVLTRVTSPTDDATEVYGTWRAYTTTNNSVLSVAKSSGWRNPAYASGVRFADIKVPKNAKILNATLTFVTPARIRYWSQPNIKISAQNSSNPAPFGTRRGNILNRNTTSSVTWNNVAATTNTETTSPSLTAMVQTLVNNNNWQTGNPMVFILKEAGSGGHQFVSYDSNPSKAPLLKIEFESNITSLDDEVEGPVTDVRSRLIEEIDAMVAKGGTPSVGALLEAKNYFSGQPVDYGLNRAKYYDRADLNRWFAPPYGRYSRVSVPESYTGGTVVRASGCNDNALNAAACASEHITGAPVYISPFADECQANHIVLLTDGEPNADTTAVNKTQSIIGKTCQSETSNAGTCGEEIAQYLSTTDLSSTVGGKQSIVTHTIGFNFNNQWLQDVAQAGGGGFYNADSASELSAALANIIDSMQDTNTSFVAPGATVDSFSKVSHRNDIYLALFQPKTTPGWTGNLKRFDFKGKPAVLVDTNSNPAVDTETGSFKETSKSFWSANVDGDNVAYGGAASKIEPAGRKVYTYQGNPALTHPSNNFSTNKIDVELLDLSDDDTVEKNKLINWALGFDVDDRDNDNQTTDSRYHIGDPLHSQPVIVNYGGTAEAPDSVIYFGTNDGFLHSIATDTGAEIFSFMPTELMRNLKPLYDSNPATGKIYGLDGALSVLVEDDNNDGNISDTDKVTLIVGMRRGGHNYYALDVSDKHNPEFKWQITGGSDGFEELGQTWSKAVSTSIIHEGSETNVIIFGGGYDSAQDNKETRSPDDIGRAIYIVSTDEGTLLWSGGPSASETRTFTNMDYSFPATPKVIDLNGDGNTDQFYIGDMGGRIWRFDINENPSGDADLVNGGIIADLANDGIIADNRRFYHSPDVSVSNIEGKQYLNIAVGSGYQAHPLDNAIKDRFYLIRYLAEANAGGHYGIPFTIQSKNDSSEDDTPVTPTVEYLPITESDLFDATSNVLGEATGEDKSNAEQELAESHGWYITMERSGEKILSSSRTFDNKILFASYVPGGAPTGCSPEIGYGIFWAVNLWDATPVTAADPESNTGPVKSDRTRVIPGGGLPAPIQTLFIESGNMEDGSDKELQVLAISGANSLMQLNSKDLVQRVYWSEYPNF